jgi:hypothetical protein
VLVIETDDLSDFFKEYTEAIQAPCERQRKRRRRLKRIVGKFEKCDPADISRFIDDAEWRRRLIRLLTRFNLDVIEKFERFLEEALNEASCRSGKDGAFSQYALWLAHHHFGAPFM